MAKSLIFLFLELILLGIGIHFIFKSIKIEKDKNVRLALLLNAFAFGSLLAIPFLISDGQEFNGIFWFTFVSFIIIEIVLFLMTIKAIKQWDKFIEVSLKIFELYIIVFVFLFFKSSINFQEQISQLPSFVAGIPPIIANILYIIFGILKTLDTFMSLKNFIDKDKDKA
ncbi:hypothetical protein DT250_04380 [Bacillus sp. AR2-1]|uniref:hypothetical protein n=1 Tax=Bacillus sp. AR2-1 TaxID=2217816 RepID=UPI0011EC8F96|nr:hypothetical protein [Bacillus sp. AR2-1]KAA0776211.1 hypothetical protein DT250_04380 [Bacillus sp. AR2-1]